ncbi:hypothetical protein GCM10010466_62320 [Planomonospora alba]|uniref:Uncharacterized protein n=1 Tax=Planomonospora alba TaxID=161354 RepID=A0ABP6P4U5_9ACTN
MTEPAASEARQLSAILAGQGGVLAAGAGLLSGPLKIATQLAGERLRVYVQPDGAEGWHEVAGSPLPVPDPADASDKAALMEHLRLHQAVVRLASVAGLPDGLTPEALDEVDEGGEST